MTSTDLETLTGSLTSGNTEQVLDRLARLDTRDVDDPDLLARVGALAEQAGDSDRAALEYNRCLRLAPEHPFALRRLARIRMEQGDDLRARRTLERLGEAVVGDEMLRDTARVLEARAARGPGARPGPGAPVHQTETLAPPGLGVRPEPVADPDDWPALDDDAVLTFVTRFSGREGVYARQWAGQGKSGYSPIHEAFSPAVARQHLSGHSTIGVYPVRMNQTVRFLAFDFDAAKTARDQAATSGAQWEAALRMVHAAAVRLLDVASTFGLTGLLEDSGWKGRHVWFFFAGSAPATAVRQLADRLLARLPALPPEVSVEVFPKQAQLRPDQLGNLIKLPLGVHRVTGRRSTFLDPAGGVLADPIEALRRIPLLDRDRLAALLAQVPPPQPVRTRARGPEAEHARTDAEPDALPPWETPREGTPAPVRYEAPPYRLEDDVEVQTLLSRCPVLRAIVDRAQTQGTLSAEERSVLTYTVGHVTLGAAAVNAVLDHVPGHDVNERLKSPLRGHPTSCQKIRAKVSALAEKVGCGCTFAAGTAAYPNPLIHVQEARARGVGAGVARTMELSLLQAEHLVEDLRRIRADLHRLNRLAREAETRLKDFMEEQALAAFETPSGVVHLDRDTGSIRLELAGDRNG